MPATTLGRIIPIDVDAFCTSVEQEDPTLRGWPVAVGRLAHLPAETA